MFGMRAKKEKERLDSIEKDLQEILQSLGITETDGNFEPLKPLGVEKFSPFRVFLNGPPNKKYTYPGIGTLTKMFSIAQCKGFYSYKFSYWNWLPNNYQKHQLKDWAISCFDKDISKIFEELDELRSDAWSEEFNSHDKNRQMGVTLNSVDFMDPTNFNKLYFKMARADIIAMRACKEQGARWGIECSFGKKYDKILKEKTLLDFYEIKKPTWKPTSDKQMKLNYELMYEKYKKLKV